jgi:hypothetical protein
MYMIALLNKYKLHVIGLVFLAGLFFIMTNSKRSLIEGFNVDIGDFGTNCPNLLMKKDDAYYLYNTTKASVPGVNPIRFEHLEEYTEFVAWLRSQGIRCPILYLQQTYDTQGQRTYRMLPDPDEPNIGMPAPLNQTNTPTPTKLIDAGHNKGSMPGFDPMNQYIGDYTPLDKMFHAGPATRDNPFNIDFAGARQAELDVESGIYAGDTVDDSARASMEREQ